MKIEKNVDGANVTISAAGRLDTTTSPEFEKELNEVLPGAENLTIDFSELEFISSAGLRVLLSAQKTMNKQGTMVVTNINDVVKEIFDVTGFSDILTIQ